MYVGVPPPHCHTSHLPYTVYYYFLMASCLCIALHIAIVRCKRAKRTASHTHTAQIWYAGMLASFLHLINFLF